MSTLTLRTPAKINLFLKVVGRRADGYHALDSRFHAVGLYDRLTLTDAPPGVITLHCSDPALAGEDNLVARAARALLARTDAARGVQARLEKRIPVGAGLGGGSSDAAAALIGLNRLWRLGLSLAELEPLAVELGSDVPFFLRGGAARVGGRGEMVAPEPPQTGLWCVLLFPGVHVDTGSVFSAYARHSAAGRLTPAPERTIITPVSAPKTALEGGGQAGGGSPASGSTPAQRWGNDLETAACALFPQVGDALDALRRAGGSDARMSGSGGTVFCLTPSRREAATIRGRLCLAPEWRAWHVPLVGTGPLVESAPQTVTLPAG